jgi:hypothetical protein
MRRREFVQAAATAYAGARAGGVRAGLLGVDVAESRGCTGALDGAFRAERRYLDSPCGASLT